MSRKAVSVVDENGVVDNNAVRRSWPFFKRLGWHFKHYWQNWLMILPAMIFVGLFAYVPMYGIQLAFRDFVPSKGLTGGAFVGFKYFVQFFTSPMFASTMINTFKISLGTLVLGFLAPIVLALLINQIGSQKIKGFVQTITYMPHFISTVVIVAMLNIFLTPQTGLIGRFLGSQSVLDNADAIAPIYWISEVWQHVGWTAIIYLAALSSVDLSLPRWMARVVCSSSATSICRPSCRPA